MKKKKQTKDDKVYETFIEYIKTKGKSVDSINTLISNLDSNYVVKGKIGICLLHSYN